MNSFFNLMTTSLPVCPEASSSCAGAVPKAATATTASDNSIRRSTRTFDRIGFISHLVHRKPSPVCRPGKGQAKPCDGAQVDRELARRVAKPLLIYLAPPPKQPATGEFG